MVIGVAAISLTTRPSSTSFLLSTTQRLKSKLTLNSKSIVASSSSNFSSPSSQHSPRKLVLYSKPGCCLCDGLKEKLQAAFLLSCPDSLHDVVLQVRDITSNPEWERAYQYEIPVLAKVLSDGSEVILPRLSPRLSVELVQKKIADALRS